MRDPIVIGVAALLAVLLLPVLVWLFLAGVVSTDGCAWIAGFGGCLGTPLHP
jgi:hypothetical protein